jgi:hypothetical protein
MFRAGCRWKTQGDIQGIQTYEILSFAVTGLVH